MEISSSEIFHKANNKGKKRLDGIAKELRIMNALNLVK